VDDFSNERDERFGSNASIATRVVQDEIASRQRRPLRAVSGFWAGWALAR
jgi:hypothetical protein